MMKPIRAILSTIAGALLLVGAFALPAQAADQRTVFDGLHGQPPGWMQSVRDTFGKVYLTVRIHDISVASNFTTPAFGSIISPVKGNITNIYTVVTASVASDPGLEAATEIVGFINGVAITGGSITIASGSVSNVSDTATPTAARAVTAGALIEFESDGKTSMDNSVLIIIEIDRDV